MYRIVCNLFRTGNIGRLCHNLLKIIRQYLKASCTLCNRLFCISCKISSEISDIVCDSNKLSSSNCIVRSIKKKKNPHTLRPSKASIVILCYRILVSPKLCFCALEKWTDLTCQQFSASRGLMQNTFTGVSLLVDHIPLEEREHTQCISSINISGKIISII